MRLAIVVFVGLAVGSGATMLVPAAWLLAPPAETAGESDEVWACPMLCVKRSKPGKCPVCGMTLERFEDTGRTITLSNEQKAMIGLKTAKVERRVLHRRIRTVGTIDYNERHVKTISAWVGGRIDKLFADHTYVEVRKDDHVMQLYSPQLFAAQREYLSGGGLKNAARRKLELLGMRPSQLEALDKSGQASEHIEILSPISGKVIALKVTEGTYVKIGTPLYTVADFDNFWLRFDAFEEDLPWIVIGQPVEVGLDALPGKTFEGTVSFIEGIVDPVTHTTKVRVTVNNADGVLKPGMLANVTIATELDSDGNAVRPPLTGRFTCYMHEHIRSDKPGKCPLCGMTLELSTDSGRPADHKGGVIAVPTVAVLGTGERHLVYVMTSNNHFEPREVRVGVRAGPWTHVLAGLEAGDTVATAGAFLLDSQMQLTGKPSLLSPGGSSVGGGHEH